VPRIQLSERPYDLKPSRSTAPLFSPAKISTARPNQARRRSRGEGLRRPCLRGLEPPSCKPILVEAGAASMGDAEVPLNHRPTPACCPSQRGPGPSCVTTICASQPYPSGVAAGCSSDSQCTDGVNGRCFPFEGLVGPGGCSTTSASPTRIVGRTRPAFAVSRPRTTARMFVTLEAIAPWTPIAARAVIALRRWRAAPLQPPKSRCRTTTPVRTLIIVIRP
jgi:hypothetical protein